MVIRQLTRANELPKDFSVTDGLFQRVTGQRGTLAGEIDEGRIFLADYDLLAPAERLCPEIGDARSRAAQRGIQLALSGSGPTLFTVADDRRDALRIARILRRIGLAAHAHTMAG